MEENKTNVLIVEDEASIRKFININLKRSGFDVMEADSGELALKILEKSSPDIVVLDIMLPGIDGFEVCSRVRKFNNDVIIILLTAKGQDMDKIMGLELGADDYMVKPFNPLELVARMRSILRRNERSQKIPERIIKTKNFILDINAQIFYKGETEIDLTPTEFSIIKLFMENDGKALSRDEILNQIWGKDYFGDIKTVDVHIRRIREKIEDNPSKPTYISTVWGLGYRWVNEK